MKKLLFLVALFCGKEVNAQNYLITFTGTGESTTVSTVKVENMTKGTSLNLNGGDVLRLTIVTGVNPVYENQTSGIKTYPNPVIDNETIEIFPPAGGNAAITVFDMNGRPVTQLHSYLEKYRQDFRLSGLKTGFYIISVSGNNYKFSGRTLSYGKSGGTVRLEKINNITYSAYEKAAKTETKGSQTIVDMPYSTGDRLKFTGTSGIYSTIKTDIPVSDKTINFNFIACTDGDNNNYPVVQTGAQVWMAENLRTTKYSNGDLIGTTTPARLDIRNEFSPKYQWAYGGIETNAATRGRLYTWYALMDNRAVCPAGWHVPTDTEWKTLEIYIGMTQEQADSTGLRGTNQGTQLKSNNIWTILDNSCYGPGTNTLGFTAQPWGHRMDSGSFESGNGEGFWWSATESEANLPGAWKRSLYNRSAKIDRSIIGKVDGLSVRCTRDN